MIIEIAAIVHSLWLIVIYYPVITVDDILIIVLIAGSHVHH